jgi:predicted RNA-binding protein YlxR (DUF448 family)
MAEAAGADATSGPRRRCIASGEVHDKAGLLRFVVGPGREIVPDPGGDLPGRGIWCLPRRDMIEKARRRGLFARAARSKVEVPEDLVDQVERLLRQRCLNRIGLARRAGQATGGFAKVRGLLEKGVAGVLLQAHDAAPDGRDKLRRLGRAVRPDLPIVAAFSADDLGRMLGRGPTVHAAVRDGRHSEGLLREWTRLAGLIGDDETTTERKNRALERDDDEQ